MSQQQQAELSQMTQYEAKRVARLIAAAPEMLDALEAIESCLAPEDNDSAARRVRAAIQKARGAQ